MEKRMGNGFHGIPVKTLDPTKAGVKKRTMGILKWGKLTEIGPAGIQTGY